MTQSNGLALYFSPLSCSFASRAVLYEVEAKVEFIEVAGDNLRAVHPLGLVPALVLEDAEVLTENAAVLQYLGLRYPEKKLVPTEARELLRMQSWLSFVGTELHKTVFAPLLSPKGSPGGAKEYALSKADDRLAYVASKLGDRTTLLPSGLSVADAYLTAVLNWTAATPIDVKRWPALVRYRKAMLERPSFARAFADERKLWVNRNPERATALGLA